MEDCVMKTLVTKMLAASAAFALLIAPEAAYAQTNTAAPKPRVTVRPNDVHMGNRTDVRVGNRTIGTDPDPFIRGEILRHRNSGWPD
jgi:hypothetical protein